MPTPTQNSGHDGTMIPWRFSDPGGFGGGGFGNLLLGPTYSFTVNMNNTTTSDAICLPNTTPYGMLDMVQDVVRFNHNGAGP